MSAGTLRARVLAHVKRNPGASCADIAGALGEAPAYVSVELRLLAKEWRIRSTGNTRGTRYYAR